MSDGSVDELTIEGSAEQRPGEFLFAAIFVLLSLLLLAFIGDQTVWAKKTRLFSQPAFWPAVSLAGMVLFGALHLWQAAEGRPTAADYAEAKVWLRSIEFALWFMAYVFVVPLLGFLPSTLIFVPLLLYRSGYRKARHLWLGVLFGFAVVVTFKGFLSVRIPGAWLYEFFPAAMRNFFILNF